MVAVEEGASLRVWHTECDTIIAVDRDDAIAVLVEMYGKGTVDAEELADELHEDRGNPYRNLTIMDDRTHDFVPVTKPLCEWVRENGRGLLCSTEY